MASEHPRPYNGFVHVWASPTACKPNTNGSPSSSVNRMRRFTSPPITSTGVIASARSASAQVAVAGNVRAARSNVAGSSSIERSSSSPVRTASVTE